MCERKGQNNYLFRPFALGHIENDKAQKLVLRNVYKNKRVN